MNSFETLLPLGQFNLNGIITKLQELHPNDWKNYVELNVSSTNPVEGRTSMSLLDRSLKGESQKDVWCSITGLENPYVILTFPKFYVIPTYYMFLGNTVDNSYPTAWNVSVTSDYKEWVTISTDKNLFNTNIIKSSIGIPFKQFFPVKQIKFTFFENNHSNGEPGACLRSIDIYGKIVYQLISKVKTFYSFSSFFHLFVIML